MKDRLKVYKYDRDSFWDDLKEENFIAEIKFKATDCPMDKLLKINGKIYAPICSRGTAGGERHGLEVKEIEISEEIENYAEDNIICPVCNFEDIDSWEAADSDDNYECPYCKSILSYVREVSPTYSTEVVKRSEVLNPELLDPTNETKTARI